MALRVLFIVANAVGKGSYWRALGAARTLVARGHQATVMATSNSARLRLRERVVDGVTLVETPDLLSGSLRSGWDVGNVLSRINYLRRHQFDLIHATECRPAVIYPALFVRRQQRIPLIIDWADWFGRGGSVEERSNWLLRTILRPIETYYEEHFRPNADGNTVICHLLYQKAQALGIPDERLFLWANGIDIDVFRPKNKQTLRQKHNLPQHDKVLVYTGAMFRCDAELMAKTFDQICANRDDVTLLLLGYSNFAVDQMVQHPGKVIRTGRVSLEDLTDYIASADLGWLPLCNTNANQGRTPLKLLDFMASGLPIVGTDVGDMGRIIKHGFVTGDWGAVGEVAPDDPHQLAVTTLKLLDDESTLKRFGAHGRQMIEQKFAWPIIIEDLEAFFKRVITIHSSDP